MASKRNPVNRRQAQNYGFPGLVASIRQVHLECASQASRAVNISLTYRNWLIGAHIHHYELQGADRATYGDKLLHRLAEALSQGQVSNCDRRQLYRYLRFYRLYPHIVGTLSPPFAALQPVAETGSAKVGAASPLSTPEASAAPVQLLTRLSYSHLEELVSLDDPLQRSFYEIEALRGNWSVRELKRQIATPYYQRSGLSTNKAGLAIRAHANAEQATPQQIIRDPYVFEFLGLKPQEAVTEGQLEDALLDKLQAFLLELGHGFCFEARQKRLLIGGEHFFVDLVFYHRVLKCLRQLGLVNELLVMLRRKLAVSEGAGVGSTSAEVVDLVAPPLRVLKAVQRDQQFPMSPEIGLSAPWLFTAGKGSPSLLQEIRRELASSDQVDILVSFITVSGVRKLQDVLQQITAKGAQHGQHRSGTRLRILTTTYTGATEARALDELARLPGCEVRVSLDGRRTRLHAKAWLFQRKSGFGSAYVGSANLSGAALTGGLEWTVKLTQRAQEALFARAVAHFETLWADSEFQRYDPDNVAHRQALAAALGREAFGGEPSATISFFDLQPKTYQQEMLEQLTMERAHGRTRNLLVAATGTGKTVVAAFDYRNTCHIEGGRPRLLFVAHREEILRQAMRTYREVLRDPEFGNLLTGSHQPERWDHLFATIDSVTSRDLVAVVGADYWHSVVVDECHRLAADRFDAFVKAVRPGFLLGLTATPERSDGQPIAQYFDARPDGSPAVEMRLWHALELQLLAPFEYYACDDATDFSAVPWDKSGEREAVDKLVTGNDVRARLVVNEWRRLTSEARRSRAVVFCVSVAHAEFMTDWFNRAGLPAACVVGTTANEDRRKAPQRLLNGELCALVTVDLYNEGIDLPMVDTLLLLRPTQSPVLFQQQIGRGLRLAPGKEACLVLDFVGQHRTEFRFDRLLSSLTGLSRRELVDGVENGFGSLPPGCHIHLQRQTREQVLQGLRALTSQNWRRLKVELQSYAALRGRASVKLADFLHDQALELEDVYRAGTGQGRSGWTALKRDAGLIVAEAGPEEDYFSRRFGDLLHVDDPRRLDLMTAVGSRTGDLRTPSASNALGVQMLAYQIDGRHEQAAGHDAFMNRIDQHPTIAAELVELSGLLQARSTLSAKAVPGLEDTPLCLHAAYGAREVLTSVGWMTASRRAPFQAGVLPLISRKTELLFVTLDKSEGYHDRIAYHDYAISTERFHWQTQNSAGPDTRSGRRYLESSTNGWQFQLFVRPRKGEAYRACGPVTLESSDGDRPMSIVWLMETPLPARLFREFSVLRGV